MKIDVFLPDIAGMKKFIVIMVLFWNLENFYDTVDSGTGSSDTEFSPAGARHWTGKRFGVKCAAIAKTLYYAAGEEGVDFPDIVCFAEVENASVVRRLVRSTLLEKENLGMVHFDSPDKRGIDVALLYRKDRMRLDGAVPLRLEEMRTRDILLARFVLADGDSLAVTVNHHPSKYGGASSEPGRRQAVDRLLSAADSLMDGHWDCQVAVGDFNDTPDSPVYAPLDRVFVNLSAPLAESGAGSIRFNGKWELIDQVFVTEKLAGKAVMKVVAAPFLTEEDRAHGGVKPRRTYTGPAYHGGVSDHYPVTVTLDI